MSEVNEGTVDTVETSEESQDSTVSEIETLRSKVDSLSSELIRTEANLQKFKKQAGKVETYETFCKSILDGMKSKVPERIVKLGENKPVIEQIQLYTGILEAYGDTDSREQPKLSAKSSDTKSAFDVEKEELEKSGNMTSKQLLALITKHKIRS